MSTTEASSTNSALRPRKAPRDSRPDSDRLTEVIADELAEVFARQRAAFERHQAPTLTERRATLLKLQRLVEQNRLIFIEAANSDFGTRASLETEVSEVVGTIRMIRHLRRHLGSWMAPRRRHMPVWDRPAKNRIEPQPLGVVGVIVPWNFPLHLALIPAATAIAAGNRVMIKTSEATAYTSSVLKRVIDENFSSDLLYVTGHNEHTSSFADLPFDRLLDHRSTVSRTAASSPVIVDEDYSIDEAAREIARAKLLNAGQAAVSPAYVLVPSGREKEFAVAARHAARSLYPRAAGNPHYTAVLNEFHYNRLQAHIADAKARGAEVITAEDPALGIERHQMPLTLVLNPPDEATVVQEEIFGPILPVIGYESEHAAVQFVNGRATPLALYVLANARTQQQKWLRKIPSGSAVVNDPLIGYLQSDLPFGPAGGSGSGAYHGREGFDAMSHLRPVSYQRAIVGDRAQRLMLAPPYDTAAELILKILRRI